MAVLYWEMICFWRCGHCWCLNKWICLYPIPNVWSWHMQLACLCTTIQMQHTSHRHHSQTLPLFNLYSSVNGSMARPSVQNEIKYEALVYQAKKKYQPALKHTEFIYIVAWFIPKAQWCVLVVEILSCIPPDCALNTGDLCNLPVWEVLCSLGSAGLENCFYFMNLASPPLLWLP